MPCRKLAAVLASKRLPRWGGMRFCVLGPLEAHADGRSVPVGGGRQRALLALLLVHAGEVVSRDRLIEELWAGNPPPGASQSLDAYLSRLRRAFREVGAGDMLATRAPGYVLHAEETDARRFEALAAEGREALVAGEEGRAAQLLIEALALWRGAAYVEVADDSWARAEAGRLAGLRLSADRRPDRGRAGARAPRCAGTRAGAAGVARADPGAADGPVDARAVPVGAASRRAFGLPGGAPIAGRGAGTGTRPGAEAPGGRGAGAGPGPRAAEAGPRAASSARSASRPARSLPHRPPRRRRSLDGAGPAGSCRCRAAGRGVGHRRGRAHRWRGWRAPRDHG